MSELKVDVAELRTAASGVEAAADMVPTYLPVDAANCGSGAVIAAAEDFNMWAAVTFQILSSKLNGQADDARLAATAFEQTEAQIALNAAG